MSYASVAFVATVGKSWASGASPRAGMTSSVGLRPILGIAPSLVTIPVIGTVVGASLNLVVSTVGLLVAVVLLVLGPIGQAGAPQATALTDRVGEVVRWPWERRSPAASDDPR